MLQRRGAESQLCMEAEPRGIHADRLAVFRAGGRRTLTSGQCRRGRRAEPPAVHSGYVPSLHTSVPIINQDLKDLEMRSPRLSHKSRVPEQNFCTGDWMLTVWYDWNSAQDVDSSCCNPLFILSISVSF